MMSRAQVVLLHVSILGVAVSGIVFAYMKYFMKSSDPFAVVNHPWQPYFLSAHVLIGPFAVFAFGWIFGNHIWPAFTNHAPNRTSGIASMLLIVPMTVSGYLMQVTTDDAIRKGFAIAHWISAALFLVGYLVHIINKPHEAP